MEKHQANAGELGVTCFHKQNFAASATAEWHAEATVKHARRQDDSTTFLGSSQASNGLVARYQWSTLSSGNGQAALDFYNYMQAICEYFDAKTWNIASMRTLDAAALDDVVWNLHLDH